MARIALIDKFKTNLDYSKYLKLDNFELFHLCSIKPTGNKVLKKDVDLDIDISEYDYIILIGSEAAKFFGGISSVTEHAGTLVKDKFIPLINPSMLSFKPEGKPAFEESINKLHLILEGKNPVNQEGDFRGIQDTSEAKKYLTDILNSDLEIVAIDTETTSLYPREGFVLGVSVSNDIRKGAYIDTSCFEDSECLKILQEIVNLKTIVMHNSKFDMKMMEYHLGIVFNKVEDTLLMHYTLDETQGTHGLKELALKYTTYGDYDKELDEFKSHFCRTNGIQKDMFTYDFIPFDIISKYAAIDASVCLELYHLFKKAIDKNVKLSKVINNLLYPGNILLKKIEDNGIPFNRERLDFAEEYLNKSIENLQNNLYSYSEIHDLEQEQKAIFNPNSVKQLRTLLFDKLKLNPTGKKTGTGQDSTDASVLEELQSEHPLVKNIMDLRKLEKIRNTYISKLKTSIDGDGRVRTFFNLTSTTSGRLSSSGKLNAQQFPRDNPLVKGCIVAPDGYVILSQDLATAEMYYAAVLSGDKELMKIFSLGGDFHSSIAKKVFNLPCEIKQVKELYPDYRQAAKSVSFGILYGSGPGKVASMTGCSIEEAIDHIDTYFSAFPRLKAWLKEQSLIIKEQGFIYSAFGRKRRVINAAQSTDKGIVAQEVRSAINFLVQSVASDINLLAAIDLQNEIEKQGLDAQIFMLVHDSIVCIVREELIESFSDIIKNCTQKDRGISIPRCPIGVDITIGKDYSFGKFDKEYGSLFEEFKANKVSNL